MWSGYEVGQECQLSLHHLGWNGQPCTSVHFSADLTAGLSFNPFTSLVHSVKFQSNPTSLSTLVADFAMKYENQLTAVSTTLSNQFITESSNIVRRSQSLNKSPTFLKITKTKQSGIFFQFFLAFSEYLNFID